MKRIFGFIFVLLITVTSFAAEPTDEPTCIGPNGCGTAFPVCNNNTFTVQYSCGKGTGTITETQSCTYGDTNAETKCFAKSGDYCTPPTDKKFVGWQCSSTGTGGCSFDVYVVGADISKITEENGAVVTLTADYIDADVVNIKIKTAGGTIDNDNFAETPDGYTTTCTTTGGKIEIPTPTRSNSSFKYWKVDDDTFDSLPMQLDASKYCKEDVNIQAYWDCNTHYHRNEEGTACDPDTITIRYNTDGGSTVDATTCLYGKALTINTIPTKTGYDFKGWYYNGTDEEVSDPTCGLKGMSDNTIELYAKWEPKTSMVKFRCEIGMDKFDEKTFEYASVYNTPAADVCKKTGYTLSSWKMTSDSDYDFEERPDAPFTWNYVGDATITAQWQPNNYTVNYYCAVDGDVAKTQIATYDTEYNHPTDVCAPAKGYKFVGWKNENDEIIGSPFIWENDGNDNYYAVFQAISYDCAAGQYLPAGATKCEVCPAGSYCVGGTYNYDTSKAQGISECPADFREGGTGLTSEGACIGSCTVSCEPKTCPEHSTNCVHGTDTESGTMTYGNQSCSATAPVCSMTFECESGYNKAGDSCVAGDMNTITYNTDGGKINGGKVESCNVESGDIVLPTDVTKTGYTFNGWYDANGAKVETIASGSCVSPITLTAQWTLNSYECSAGQYLPAGATECEVCPAGSYCVGGTYKYDAEETQGKITCGANSYSDAGAGECTPCANGYTNSNDHAGIASCKITCPAGEYVAEAGKGCVSVGTGYYGQGGTVGQDSVLARTQCPVGYREGPAATQETDCMGSCDVPCFGDAVCPENSVECTHDSSVVSTGIHTYGNQTCSATAVECPVSGFECESGYNKAGDRCVAGDMNTITYNTNDGKINGSKVESCNVESGDIVLPTDVTKTGYTFAGWYDANGDKVETIASGSCVSPITLTALWTLNSYDCAAGQYLPAGATKCEVCPAGSYCVGSTYSYDTTKAQGISDCPSGYTDGGTGLTTQAQCVMTVPGGNYVATANAELPALCMEGMYKAAHTVYYGQTSSCETCSNWSYSGLGAASCTDCPALTDGWSKTDSTSTGWKSYTSCKQTQKPANCTSGAVTQTAISSTQWGTSVVTTALTANANHYVADTVCVACRDGFLSPENNTGDMSSCKKTVVKNCEYSSSDCPENSTCDYDMDYTESSIISQGTVTGLPPQTLYCPLVDFTCNDGYRKTADGSACEPGMFKVIYHLDGGTNYDGAPTEFDASVGVIISGKPTKAGYEFIGWSLFEDMSHPSNGITVKPEAATGDLHVWAKWSACPSGYYCDGVKHQCPETHPESAPQSDKLSDCYQVCETHETDGYMIQEPVNATEYYNFKCSYREPICHAGYEMIGGVCHKCARDNALTYSRGCEIESCASGYHPNGDKCDSDTISCSVSNAMSAVKKWNSVKKAYDKCMIAECDDGYHISANTCVPDEEVCEIENGTGIREWNHRTNSWGECIATRCDPGYTNDASQTNEAWNQCGRCNNAYSVGGELAVSSYVRECEIASCLYQGELYALENNECRLICDEYSDETGRRYWDSSRKKCVQECADGYTSW